MGRNINQIVTGASSILPTDKLYGGRSPFGLTDDRYILGSVLIAQFSPRTFSTVGTGGDYATVAAAFLAGKFYLELISDVTETTDFVNTSATTVDIFIQNPKGFALDCNVYTPFYASGNTTLNITLDSLQISYAYASDKSLFKAQSAGTVININSYNTTIVNGSDETIYSWVYDAGSGALNLYSLNDSLSIPITILPVDTRGGYNITKGNIIGLNGTGSFNLGSLNFNAVITMMNSFISGQMNVYCSFAKIGYSYFGVSGGTSTISVSNTSSKVTLIGNTTGVPIVDNGTSTELASNTLY